MARPFLVIDVEQGTPEWYAARAGRLTASDAAILLVKPKKGQDESVQRRDLRVRLAVEQITGRAEDDGSEWKGADVKRGKELEGDARAAYEIQTGALVQAVGMLHSPDLPIGCSPDGIVGDFDGGLELKCPKPAIHLGYLRDGSLLVREYQSQIIHSLFVSRLPWWDLVSYCPVLPEPLRLQIVRTRIEDVDLAAHELNVRQFLREVEAEHAAIVALAASRQAVAA